MSWSKLYTTRSYYPHPNGAVVCGLGDAARVKQYRAVAFLTGTLHALPINPIFVLYAWMRSLSG